MKKFFFALSLMTVMGLTSCLSDDDNENQGLTPQEMSQYFNAIRGDYNGKLLFEVNNPNDPKDYADTLDIAWRVAADTTVVIDEFPQVVILDRIKDNELKEALAAAAPVQLKAQIGFFKSDFVSFLLYPYAAVYDIEYQGAMHKASLAFWFNAYSYGIYNPLDKLFEMQFVIAGLYLDDNNSHNYLTNSSYDNYSIPIVITNGDLSKKQ